MNFGSGTAKFGEVKLDFMLFHFMYKLCKITPYMVRNLAEKLDNFVELGQVMAIGGMKTRLFVKHMAQQG